LGGGGAGGEKVLLGGREEPGSGSLGTMTSVAGGDEIILEGKWGIYRRGNSEWVWERNPCLKFGEVGFHVKPDSGKASLHTALQEGSRETTHEHRSMEYKRDQRPGVTAKVKRVARSRWTKDRSETRGDPFTGSQSGLGTERTWRKGTKHRNREGKQTVEVAQCFAGRGVVPKTE